MKKKTTTKKLKTTKRLSTLPSVYKNKTPKEIENFPLSHYSPSSMTLFSTNPIIFRIRYINGDEFDQTRGISAIIGTAFHKAMEVYYGGSDEIVISNEQEAIEHGLKTGMQFLEFAPEGFITFSKTIPTKQKAMELFAQAFNFYVKERKYNNGEEVLACEKKMEDHISLDWKGQKLELPIKLKGYTDKIVRKPNGKIRIVDYKTTQKFSDGDKIDGAKIIQAIIYYLLVAVTYGEEPEDFVFEEVKMTQNRDGGDQVKNYTINFSENELFFDFFFRFYEDMTRALCGEMVYMPNLNAMYDNEVAIISYIHRLDVSEEQAKLLKKYNVKTLTDILKREIQNAGNMRKLLSSLEDKFKEAKSINYEKMTKEEKIQTKMLEHGIAIKFDSIVSGASVDMYQYMPSMGLKMSKLKTYTDDIEQVLGISGVRVLAPIPGTTLVGFEIPREDRRFPMLLQETTTFDIAIGETIMGECYRFDIRTAPHVLISGATGSGKSRGLDIIIGQLCNLPRTELILLDPKMVELIRWADKAKIYKETHMDICIVLQELVKEMDATYTKLQKSGERNIDNTSLNYKFIVLDEYSDLVLSTEKVQVGEKKIVKVYKKGTKTVKVPIYDTVGNLVNLSIKKLAQKGRAAGIHIILTTQRPSTKVIDGDIKANFPTRIAFRTVTDTDSQVILDQGGAEKLLGKGDMLFSSDKGIVRLQGYSS